MRDLEGRLRRLEERYGHRECTCGEPIVRLVSGPEIERLLEIEGGCPIVRRTLLWREEPCPVHGEVPVRVVNMTGQTIEVANARWMGMLRAKEARSGLG